MHYSCIGLNVFTNEIIDYSFLLNGIQSGQNIAKYSERKHVVSLYLLSHTSLLAVYKD